LGFFFVGAALEREKLKLGGTEDTLALLSLGVSFCACLPDVPGRFSMDWKIATATLAAIGSLHLTRRIIDWYHGGRHVIDSNLEIDSKAPFLDVGHNEQPTEAALLGYITNSGKPFWVPLIQAEGFREVDPFNDHLSILGMSGSGKTVAASLFMFQQILNGGAVIFADGKIDEKNIIMLWHMLRYCGREDDLVIIRPGDPEISNKYNPILIGDADEIASRIMAMIPQASNSAGADYYRKSATQALTALIAALQRGGYAFTAADLSLLLLSPTELEKLPNLPGIRGTPEGRNVALFINRFRVPNRAGGTMIDVNKVKDLFGGIGGRLGQIGSGKVGEVVNTTKPDVSLYDCIMQGKVVYVALPTMGKEETASDFAKLFVGDYRTALSWIQTLPEEKRPNPSTLVFMDEPGAYLSESWDRLFEQARSARQRIVLSPQTKGNLDSVSENLFNKAIGNCANKAFFGLGDQDTAEYGADFIGKTINVLRTLAETSSDSASESATDVSGSGAASGGAGTSTGEREQEMYRVTPDDLKALDKGECIFTRNGKDYYHVRVPLLSFSDEFKAWAGPYRLWAPEDPKRPRPYRSDYGLVERLDSILRADEEYIKAQFPAKKESKKDEHKEAASA
jgi:hypothetical protein